jgi:protein tyrosine/serine phosphatase
VRAWLDMMLVDHGLLRAIYWNLHPVAAGAWRAAQPSPRRLKQARSLGVRTVLNLRGRRDTCGSYILEREAAERLGLTLIDFPIRSRSPLDRVTVLAAVDLLESLEGPLLMHCKSGADRAGFMATLYRFLHEGVPLERAMDQLSLRYLHLKHAKTGIIDFFFERFQAETDGSQAAFRPWVETRYDPAALKAAFRETWLAGLIVDRILRRE